MVDGRLVVPYIRADRAGLETCPAAWEAAVSAWPPGQDGPCPLVRGWAGEGVDGGLLMAVVNFSEA